MNKNTIVPSISKTFFKPKAKTTTKIGVLKKVLVDENSYPTQKLGSFSLFPLSNDLAYSCN
jgi:hypothetical protein